MAGGKAKGLDLFNALGHPMRRRVLREMLDVRAEISPRELAAELGEQLSALSYHVRVLAECGAIELVRTERIRGSTQHFYRPVISADWALEALETEQAPRGAKGRRQGEESP
ncbi:MAG TPA: helix-turn-helix domain-containing protein [Solirubrobacterales bacterium]|nr:helix-turn-helix domain-containing protein [Solirubrobacterales bacterium]